jgi:hypothetical protein
MTISTDPSTNRKVLGPIGGVDRFHGTALYD